MLSVIHERLHILERVVKNKDECVPVPKKNQPIVEIVPAFHVSLDTPQAQFLCGGGYNHRLRL